MYAEIESRRRSSSLIAKLMGLEGQPSSLFVHRQQRENVSAGIQRLRQPDVGQWSRRCSVEQQEFKDLGGSHIVKPRLLSRRSANSILSKSEMTPILQKIIDTNCLSSDEELQDSKELYDTTELLDSKEKSLLKLPRKGNSLSVKHLHDLQGDRLSSLGRHITVLKPSNSEKYDCSVKAANSESDTSSKPDISYHLKHRDCVLPALHDRHRSYVSPMSSNIELDEKNEARSLPMRIVLLKPNLGKMRNSGTSNSSLDHLHGYLCNFKKINECSSIGSAWKSDTSYSEEFKKPMSIEDTEISMDIPGRMKVDSEEADRKSSGVRGYAGDESSYDVYESDSDSQSETFKFSSQNFLFDDKWSMYSSSSPTLAESYFNREAKKRLSERWKTTNRFQDVETVGKGRTLGEMLAIADEKESYKYFNAKMSTGWAWNKLGSNNGSLVGVHPLGIRSRDGWENNINETLCKSRSLPRSIGERSHRKSSFNKTMTEDKCPSHSDSVRHGTSEMMKGTLNQKENCSTKNSRTKTKKPLPCQQLIINKIDYATEAGSDIQMKVCIMESSGPQPMFQMGVMDETCLSTVSDVLATSEQGSASLPLKSSELCPRQSLSAVDIYKSAAHSLDGSSLQCLGAELDSSEGSKEADHLSPISVLRTPFVEDVSSSSKSFERVKAKIRELRIQLQLFKIESSAHAAASTLGPIKDEVSQLYPLFSKKTNAVEHESWEITYALDVLINSGLEQSGTADIFGKHHSPSFPLDPRLFENLEKKNSNEKNGLRSERRLLFDTINLTLFELFQQQVFSHSTQQNDGIMDALAKFINEASSNRATSERVLDREMLWSDSRGEIDVMGIEIEKFLTDNLIAEVLYE